MASLREAARPLRQIRISQLSRQSITLPARRWYSAEAAAAAADEMPEFQDLEPDSSQATPEPTPEQIQKFGNPKTRAAGRKYQLHASRYQYHPPRFQRGQLHPIQSLPSSDPLARDFLPGPFYYPRLKETWATTVAPDLMTLLYMHKKPGEVEEPIGQRLRSWDGSSPYHKNRPLRRPRGGDTLRPVERDITFRNVPEVIGVHVGTFMPMGAKEPTYLLTARAALQAVTGAKPTIRRVRRGVSQWGMSKGQLTGAAVSVYGEQAYELLDKMVHLVFPRIRDWRGINARTGDESGNLQWGFSPDEFALFPEIQANYDGYPPKMIPGCNISVETTAKSDRHARLLLMALGVPFREMDD